MVSLRANRGGEKKKKNTGPVDPSLMFKTTCERTARAYTGCSESRTCSPRVGFPRFDIGRARKSYPTRRYKTLNARASPMSYTLCPSANITGIRVRAFRAPRIMRRIKNVREDPSRRRLRCPEKTIARVRDFSPFVSVHEILLHVILSYNVFFRARDGVDVIWYNTFRPAKKKYFPERLVYVFFIFFIIIITRIF